MKTFDPTETNAANDSSSPHQEERVESSGLLDIRSMASIYLADMGNAAAQSPIANDNEDLPDFDYCAFESASPVLLPTPCSGPGTRLLYTLAGVAAALIVAATGLLVLVLQSDGTRAVAQAETPLAEVTAPLDVADAPIESAALAPAETKKPPAKRKAEPAKEKAEPAKERAKPAKEKAKPAKEKTEPAKTNPAAATTTCDEVTCLVSPESACCQLKERNRRAANPALYSKSSLPEFLGRSDIKSGMGKVRSRFQRCGKRHGAQGSVKLHAKIGGDGRVKQARATGGNARLRACVLATLKRATFRKTQRGRAVAYPVVFR